MTDYRKALDLAGRRAVVTGGAGGIGLETARALGQCGAHVVLLDMGGERLEQAAAALAGEGLSVSACAADVTDAAALDAAAGREGDVDILATCAGIARLGTTLSMPDADWTKVIDVNLNGVYRACRAFGRGMVERGSGSIVNIGSMSGLMVNSPQTEVLQSTSPAYMASKAAVHMLTKALAVEWAARGVRVNALAPGYVATDMTLAMRDEPALFMAWMDRTPMGRCAAPGEIAAAVLFLASPAAAYVTGAVLSIDGGYTAC